MLHLKTRYTRRTMISLMAKTGAAVAAPWFIPSSARGRDGAIAPSERIVLGGLGLGSRGTGDLRSFLENPDVQFVAICDVRKERREAIKQIADQRYGTSDCAMYRNMHEMLARPDIDAVLIATGDRWHHGFRSSKLYLLHKSSREDRTQHTFMSEIFVQ